MNPNLTHGAVSWSELMTADPMAAVPFYGRLFGWTSQAMATPQGDYHVQSLSGCPVAGVMALPHQPMPSAWCFYVTVDDVDRVVATAVELGARVAFGPDDVATVGRMAGLFDPQGAYFSVIRYAPMEGAQGPEPDFVGGFTTHGAFSWFHLNMTDVEAAIGFYTDLFGWKIKVEQMEGGPYNTLQVGDVGIGGIMPVMSEGIPAHWSGFVTVKDVDATVAEAVAAGGTAAFPAFDVAGVGRIGGVTDPTGAVLQVAAYVPMP